DQGSDELTHIGAAMSVLTLAQASTIVDVALRKGRDTSCAPLTVAVLDAGGHLVAFKREDKSGILRFDIAFGKAWGALGMGFGSRELADRAGKNPLFFGVLARAETRSEEHTSELQSRRDLVCRLLLEKKKMTVLT